MEIQRAFYKYKTNLLLRKFAEVLLRMYCRVVVSCVPQFVVSETLD